MNLTRDDIEKYYQTCDLWLPDYPAQRQFKLRSFDGSFKKVKRTISSEKALRRLLLAEAPTDVWYSAARYLDPKNLEGIIRTKPGHVVADSCILKVDLPFDIDGSFSIEGLEDARKRTLALISSIEQKPKYILFSGNKGFQAVYDWKDEISEDARKREQNIRFGRERKAYIRERLKLHIRPVDWDVSLNPRTIIRLPLTARSNGFVATILTEEDLQRPIKELVPKFKHVTSHSPAIPKQPSGKMTTRITPQKKGVIPLHYKEQDAGKSGPSPAPNIIAVSNRVGKRGVVLLKYEKTQAWQKDLQHLNKKFQLGPITLLKYDDIIYAVSIVAFDTPQLRKVYKASRSLNKSGFLKYEKAFLRIPVKDNFRIQTEIIPGLAKRGNPVSTIFEKLLKTKAAESDERTKKGVEVRIPATEVQT